jgi:hypothetical protein
MKIIRAMLIIAASVAVASCSIAVPKGDFNVTAAVKTAASPQVGKGNTVGYVVNGTEGLALTVVRGTKYTFAVNAPGHPLYLTTSSIGGPSGLGNEWLTGVTGSRTDVGTVTFTPDATTPSLLYYQCSVHDNMGWTITVTP